MRPGNQVYTSSEGSLWSYSLTSLQANRGRIRGQRSPPPQHDGGGRVSACVFDTLEHLHEGSAELKEGDTRLCEWERGQWLYLCGVALRRGLALRKGNLSARTE